jgi:hypothetical protein
VDVFEIPAGRFECRLGRLDRDDFGFRACYLFKEKTGDGTRACTEVNDALSPVKTRQGN